MLRMAAATLAALSFAAHPASADEPRLDQLLVRVARQVAQFKSDFSLIVGVEHYSQVLRTANRTPRNRELVSDVFFYSPESSGPAMTVRTIRRVDGSALRAPADQIERALALPPAARTEKLRALADAGASYNLGNLQRNFNEPTVALTFAAADFQRRFRYSLERPEEVDGETLQCVAYREVEHPTVIRDGNNGSDIPASGRLWTTADGVVKRTELHVERRDTTVTIRVSYRREPRLGVMVPVTMDEDYRYRERNNRRFTFVTAHAAYSEYRRFETSVRILPN